LVKDGNKIEEVFVKDPNIRKSGTRGASAVGMRGGSGGGY
jgi:hypothetical protein